MRFGWLAAAAAMICAIPASAATIVQTDNETIARGFRPFDARFGQLEKVTLDIDIQKFRVWQIEAPVVVDAVKRVDWLVDGIWSLDRSSTGLASDTIVALTGAGASIVTLSEPSANGAPSYFAVEGRASTSLDLPVPRFLDRDIYFFGFDNGYRDASGSDSTVSVQGPAKLLHLDGTCGLVSGRPLRIDQEFCGNLGYRLTCDYAPAAITSGVPELATWTMILVGFGAIGFGMRSPSVTRPRSSMPRSTDQRRPIQHRLRLQLLQPAVLVVQRPQPRRKMPRIVTPINDILGRKN